MFNLSKSDLLSRLQSQAALRQPRKKAWVKSSAGAIIEVLEQRKLLSAATVTAVAASSVDSTSATLGGNITDDGGSLVTERGIVYSLTSDNSSPQIGGANVVQLVDGGTGTGSFSLNASSLSLLSNYSFAAYAINGDGTAYSAVSTFSTLNDSNLIVTTADDVVDGSDGVVSLREAVNYANSTPSADTITFGGSVFTDATPDTILLNSGQLNITESVTISGPGASSLTIDAQGSSRVFYLFNNSKLLNVTLSGMTITGGSQTRGGGICDIDENLTLVDSVVTGNSAGQNGGGLFADGFTMSLTVRRTTISNNTAGRDGGGVYVEDTGGLFLFEDSTITGNTAADDGGGINFYDPDHDIQIIRTTIANNTAGDAGGGIYLYSMDSGSFTIENSTVTGNHSAVGGGVYFYNPDTPFSIRSCTISDNTASTEGGGLLVYEHSNSTFDITNTILAGNVANSAADDLTILIGGFSSVTNTLIEAMGANTLNGATTSGNILGQDPQLGLLGDYGGYTQTQRLSSSSPAINAGNTGGASTDQRGVARDSAPDIGAYEFAPPVLANLETAFLPYAPNDPATPLTSTLTLSDPQSTSLSGATIQLTSGYQAGDLLSFSDTANITGSWDGAGTLTLSGSDTLANYEAAIRSVTYSSTSQSSLARTVSIQITDGISTSNTLSRTIGGEVQLVGTSLNVYGTSNADTISVAEGANVVVVWNGVTQTYSSALATAVVVHGYAGSDTLLFTGTPGNETVTLSPGRLGVVGTGYTVQADGVETVRAYAAGGAGDVAHLYDSAGNDMFTGRPTMSSMTGTGYSNTVNGFKQVIAHATAGDAGGVGDRAYLYDSAGNDVLIADSNHALLKGTGFSNDAAGFDKVYAYATAGDAGGVGDQANLFDSAGNDTLFATPTYAQMTGNGYFNYASNFDRNYAYATAGDAGGVGDRAYLYDSAGNDTLTATPVWNLLRGTGYYNYVQNFDQAYVYATTDAGGVGDQSFLYDSAGNDMLTATPGHSLLAGPGYSNYSENFDSMVAYATAGDAGGVGDRAYLYDSAGNDTLVADPTHALLRGPGYSNDASGFDQVYAYASTDAGGAGDQASLFDSAGNDTLTVTPTYGQMSGPGYLNYASKFDRVFGYASTDAGGTGDRANFFDSAGNDSFSGTPFFSQMTGTGYTNYVQNFDQVYAYATAGGVQDQATVNDSTGNDSLYGRADYATLQGPGFYIYLRGFDQVTANAYSGGVDTVDVHNVQYQFLRFGSWENVI